MTEQEFCEATLLQKDDRWGGFILRCEGGKGHIGPHTRAMTACEPIGWMSWIGTYTEPKQARPLLSPTLQEPDR